MSAWLLCRVSSTHSDLHLSTVQLLSLFVSFHNRHKPYAQSLLSCFPPSSRLGIQNQTPSRRHNPSIYATFGMRATRTCEGDLVILLFPC